ncbi:ChaB family protein [Anthocerotibacter panamensis]|uniref:ChaB family protein n=1 Tax=Anthocerotibacter panamensis TaxID=2857077 RepID=UPI001C40629F|nr:ChaB family protein [Anthocerotibacter panamensis]
MTQAIAPQGQVYTGQVEKAITAVLKEQLQVDQAVRQLLDIGVPREDISIMGRNFQSHSQVSGFLTKGDVIRGGLVNGALYGALFGSFLSLLTGIGVLFIPFVGPVIAAGPLAAALLGAAGGAVAGSVGAGLASVFLAMGMPEEKVNIYQTRLQAGEFVLVVEGLAAQVTQIRDILERLGAEEVAVMNQTLPREKPGIFVGPEELAPHVRQHLSPAAQRTYIQVYNAECTASGDETRADLAAWDAVRRNFKEDEQGQWA